MEPRRPMFLHIKSLQCLIVSMRLVRLSFFAVSKYLFAAERLVQPNFSFFRSVFLAPRRLIVLDKAMTVLDSVAPKNLPLVSSTRVDCMRSDGT